MAHYFLPITYITSMKSAVITRCVNHVTILQSCVTLFILNILTFVTVLFKILCFGKNQQLPHHKDLH